MLYRVIVNEDGIWLFHSIHMNLVNAEKELSRLNDIGVEALISKNKCDFGDGWLIVGNYMFSSERKPCSICGRDTNRIDICSESRICSSECEKEFNIQYDEWLKYVCESEEK